MTVTTTRARRRGRLRGGTRQRRSAHVRRQAADNRALHPPPCPANSATSLCPRRLVWPRTLAFHAGNVGSNPAGDAPSRSAARAEAGSALRHGRRAGRLRLSIPQRAGPRADPIQQEIEQRPVKPAQRRDEYRNCPQPHPPRERHGCHATKRRRRIKAGRVTKSSHSCERQDAERRPAAAGSLIAQATRPRRPRLANFTSP